MTETTVFQRPHRIRFSECDPAGIVFYPQYFVMFNDLLEAWVDAITTGGFHDMIGKQHVGMPTVHLDADFKAISRMGDDVVLSLAVEHLGSRSLRLVLRCVGTDGVLRMQVNQVIVTTSLVTHKAIQIPEAIRQAMQAYVLPQEAVAGEGTA
ncbi:acyl-CoA thioesterase [Kerstersia sp.]|uniref:acyl-CoA thioesterase n=1 Tax=Kerstersia sp. TaxID=1930783 RepID=UPI003F933E66